MNKKDNIEIPFTNVSMPLIALIQGGGHLPFEAVELNRESREYIHVRLKNVI